MISHGCYPWTLETGDGPILATAIHNGHDIRPELIPHLAISEADRLREEDPFTSRWTAIAPNRLVVYQSRFEFDLNRPREKAVYQTPEDAWGLQVWQGRLAADQVEKSLGFYDAFYREVTELLNRMIDRYGRVVILDLHSYNHRRGGPGSQPAPEVDNPEVNVGTGTMDRNRWASVVDLFMDDLRRYDFQGRSLDVRENVKFKGGYFPTWVHANFPETVCVLSVEFKKFFMDEWTGRVDEPAFNTIQQSLASAANDLYKLIS